MMTCESSQRCWLHCSLLDQIVPAPKFAIGQPVLNHFTDESGVTHCDRGIVIGVLFNSDNWSISGWVYWVRWWSLPSTPLLPLPYLDEIHESDLRPDGGNDA
jgi:hypothetical protein